MSENNNKMEIDNNNNSGVFALPSEIWLHVIKFLHWRELDLIRCVCREFRDLVDHVNNISIWWKNHVSTKDDVSDALDEVFQEINTYQNTKPSVAVVFISSEYDKQVPTLIKLINKRLPPTTTVLAAVVNGVIGMGKQGKVEEFEDGFALSFSMGHLGVASVVRAFDSTNPLEQDSKISYKTILLCPNQGTRARQTLSFLTQLQSSFSDAHIIGGWTGSPLNFIIQNGIIRKSPLVGLALGELRVEIQEEKLSKFTTTSSSFATRGVLPVGPLFEVTMGSESNIYQVRKASEQSTIEGDLLMSIAESTGGGGQGGFVVPVDSNDKPMTDLNDVYYSEFGFSRTLNKILLQVWPASGLKADVKPGFKFMFAKSTPNACLSDIKAQLQRQQQQFSKIIGAFQFQCAARGSGLYGGLNHEATVFNSCLPKIPMSGFFAGGEICSLGPNNNLKANQLSFTSVYGLLVRQRH